MKTILERAGDCIVILVFATLFAGGLQRTFDMNAPLPFSHLAHR